MDAENGDKAILGYFHRYLHRCKKIMVNKNVFFSSLLVELPKELTPSRGKYVE